MATRAIIAPKRGPSPSIRVGIVAGRAGIVAAEPGKGSAMEARTVLMGDWSRTVRDPIDLLRLTFFVGAAVFLLLGEMKGVGNLLVGGIALLVARGIDLPRLYDLGFTIAMIFTALSPPAAG
jgi:hypothetical protein